MEILDQFVANNLILIILWFVLLYMIINSYIKGAWDRSPQQVVQILNSGSGILLDVREDSEFQQGHIVNAKHIPMGQVKDRLKELEPYKQKPVVVSCRSGHRSAKICGLLKKHGFSEVYNLRGGILAWENDKLPVTRK